MATPSRPRRIGTPRSAPTPAPEALPHTPWPPHRRPSDMCAVANRCVRRRAATVGVGRPRAPTRGRRRSRPAGRRGRGHDTSASATASWAASSASPKSPVNRVSAATIRADSIRQTASTSAVPIRSGRCSRAGPFLDGLLVVLRDLVVPGHPPDLDLGPGDRRDPLGPLDRLLFRGDIEQEVAPEQFLGLAVRPVRDHRGLAAEVDHDALARIVQPFGRDEHAGLDQLLDELVGRGRQLFDPAIMAAFDSSVPRMISMYFGIAFSSSGGAASRPSHPHVERAARGSTRPRRNLSPRRSRSLRPAFRGSTRFVVPGE